MRNALLDQVSANNRSWCSPGFRFLLRLLFFGFVNESGST